MSGAACRWKCAENLGACSLWAVPRLKLCSGGSASPRAPTSGSLWCLQKVEAWQSPTRFSVIQRAKIKQIKQYYYYFFFGPCSKLHSTAVALCVGMKYVKWMGIQYFLGFLFKASHRLRRSSSLRYFSLVLHMGPGGAAFRTVCVQCLVCPASWFLCSPREN